MALQTMKGGLWGGQPFTNANPTFATTLLLDASGEKAAFVFQVPKTGTLDKVEFRTGAVTINAGSVMRASFQDLTSGGLSPDGTQDQYRDIAAASVTANTWIVPGLMTADGTDGGAKRSVTRGQWMAVVIEFSTFTSTNSVQVSSLTKLTFASLPYCLLYTSSWAEPSANLAPVMALKYNDGTYEFIPGCFPFSTFTSQGFNNSSTPDERGLYFQIPFPARISGAFAHVDATAFARDFSIVLYAQSSDTPLATITVDADQTAALNNLRGGMFLFSSQVSLSANTNYRLVLKPGTASNNSIQEFDVNSAAIMDACEGGQNWHHTSRTDGATTGGTLNDGWTQTTTKRPFIYPLFDQFDDGAGGGAGIAVLTRGGLAR